LHSIAFSHAVPDGTILAVEASPTTYVQLLRNVKLLGNVITLNVALSSESGVTEFFVASDNAYSGMKDTGLKLVREKIRVPCFTGDLLINALQIGRIDLVKVDVEGFETSVIRGLRETIDQSRPTIFCEIYEGLASNPDAMETISIMMEARYRAYVIVNGKLAAFKSHSDENYNYIFVAEERTRSFPFLPNN
jgi:FkbM family methyltransferase